MNTLHRQPLHQAHGAAPASSSLAGDGYLPALDGLRAIAVLFVMTSHIVTERIPGGFGVTLFFFISGFIISRNCLEHGFGVTDVVPFYVKRFFRLAPAVFAYILCAIVVVEWLGSQLPWSDVAATVFYYANYHHYSNAVGHFKVAPLEMTWSLAVEEHFYVVFPAAVVWARRPLRLAVLMVAVIVATCLWRQWLTDRGAPFWSLYAHTDTRIDSIAYGCLLAATLAVAAGGERAANLVAFLGHRVTVVVGLVGLVFTLWAEAAASYAQLHLVQGLAFMPIFCALFASGREPTGVARRWLGSRFLVWTGRLSYSLYLFHVIANYATKEIGLHTYVRVIAAFGLSFLCAWLSYSYIETPGRRWGRQLARRVSDRAGAAARP